MLQSPPEVENSEGPTDISCTNGRRRWDRPSVCCVGRGLWTPTPKTPTSSLSVDCYVMRWSSERGFRCLSTNPHGSRPSLTSRSTPTTTRPTTDHCCSKMEAIMMPALWMPRLTLLGPMHYDPCALYWVPRCRGRAMVGRAHSVVVAHRFWSSSQR